MINKSKIKKAMKLSIRELKYHDSRARRLSLQENPSYRRSKSKLKFLTKMERKLEEYGYKKRHHLREETDNTPRLG